MTKRKLKKCTRCPNKISIIDKYATCFDCRTKGKKRLKNKKKCKGKIKNGNPCASKVSEKCGNEYCNNHPNQWLLSEARKEDPGAHLCASGRNCNTEKPKIKTILPSDYLDKSCRLCLDMNNYIAIKKRAIKKNINLVNTNSNTRICLKCPENNNKHPIDNMCGITKDYCKNHYTAQQKNEANRIIRKRDYNEYESRPGVKLMRKIYRLEHPEKTYTYYASYRGRQLRENPIEYRARQAIYAKIFKKDHPDKVKENEEKRKTNIYCAYSYYRRTADIREYDFELSDDVFCNLVSDDCYYCGYYNNKYFNGIDRMDNAIGYTEKNSVSCCEMCNMMKNTLNEPTFILMCAHIANYNKLTTIGRLYPKVFNNYSSSNYNKTESRAGAREKTFTLLENEFDKIKKKKQCYICGKENSNYHTNGIDRKDNNEGYVLSNCQLCCGDCNYLKKNYNYDDFLEKCKEITICNRKVLDVLYNDWTPSKFLEKNISKLSPEEKKKKQQLRKEIREEMTLASKSAKNIRDKANTIEFIKKMTEYLCEFNECIENRNYDKLKISIDNKLKKSMLHMDKFDDYINKISVGNKSNKPRIITAFDRTELDKIVAKNMREFDYCVKNNNYGKIKLTTKKSNKKLMGDLDEFDSYLDGTKTPSKITKKIINDMGENIDAVDSIFYGIPLKKKPKQKIIYDIKPIEIYKLTKADEKINELNRISNQNKLVMDMLERIAFGYSYDD